MARSQRSLRKSYGSKQGSYQRGSVESQSVNPNLNEERQKYQQALEARKAEEVAKKQQIWADYRQTAQYARNQRKTQVVKDAYAQRLQQRQQAQGLKVGRLTQNIQTRNLAPNQNQNVPNQEPIMTRITPAQKPSNVQRNIKYNIFTKQATITEQSLERKPVEKPKLFKSKGGTTFFNFTDAMISKYGAPVKTYLQEKGITAKSIGDTAEEVGQKAYKFSPAPSLFTPAVIINEVVRGTPLREIPAKLKQAEKKGQFITGQISGGVSESLVSDFVSKPSKNIALFALGGAYSKIVAPLVEITGAKAIIAIAPKVSSKVVETAIKVISKTAKYGLPSYFGYGVLTQSYSEYQSAPEGQKIRAGSRPFGSAIVEGSAFVGGAYLAKKTTIGNQLVRESYRQELVLGATKEKSRFQLAKDLVDAERMVTKFEFGSGSLKPFTSRGVRGVKPREVNKLNEFLGKQKGLRATGSSAQSSFPVEFFEAGTVQRRLIIKPKPTLNNNIKTPTSAKGKNDLRIESPTPPVKTKPNTETIITGDPRIKKDIDLFKTNVPKFKERAGRVIKKDVWDLHQYGEKDYHPYARPALRVSVEGTKRTIDITSGREQLGRKVEGVLNLGTLEESGTISTTYRAKKDLPDAIQIITGLRDEGVTTFLRRKMSAKEKEKLFPILERIKNFQAPASDKQFKVGSDNVRATSITTNYIEPSNKGLGFSNNPLMKSSFIIEKTPTKKTTIEKVLTGKSIPNNNLFKPSKSPSSSKIPKRPSFIPKTPSFILKTPSVIPNLFKPYKPSISKIPSPRKKPSSFIPGPSKIPSPSKIPPSLYNFSGLAKITTSTFTIPRSKIPSGSTISKYDYNFKDYITTIPDPKPLSPSLTIGDGFSFGYQPRSKNRRKYRSSLLGIAQGVKRKRQGIDESTLLSGLEIRGI